jgi:hypothetical protein
MQNRRSKPPLQLTVHTYMPYSRVHTYNVLLRVDLLLLLLLLTRTRRALSLVSMTVLMLMLMLLAIVPYMPYRHTLGTHTYIHR